MLYAAYIHDLDTFLDTVEADAVSFTPLGTKIHSYTRLSSSPLSSNGADADASTSSAAGDDLIEYEVYHVSHASLSKLYYYCCCCCSLHYLRVKVDMAHRRLPRIP